MIERTIGELPPIQSQILTHGSTEIAEPEVER